MPTIWSKAIGLLTGEEKKVNTDWLKMPKKRQYKKLTERELIRREAEVGSTLFGKLPSGHRREFFCLDKVTWIWHEEWIDEATRRPKTATTRYEIQKNGILKVQEGAKYSYVEGQELDNLLKAMQLYYERVARQVYETVPQHIA